MPFGKQIWRRVLAHETPAGAVFGTVPVGVSACPLMPGLPYAGGGCFLAICCGFPGFGASNRDA